MKMSWILATRASAAVVLVGALALTGCSQSETASDGTAEPVAATNVDLSHGGWWCVEHGVPEEECARCDKTLVSTFKEAGDWCDEHDRPESQCFICNPKRFDKFAATYEAKTGRNRHSPNRPIAHLIVVAGARRACFASLRVRSPPATFFSFPVSPSPPRGNQPQNFESVFVHRGCHACVDASLLWTPQHGNRLLASVESRHKVLCH